jgi:hypothetical protein
MRITALLLFAITLGACSATDDARAREDADRAREQGRQAAEQVKRESKVALNDAEVEAKKAGKEIDRGLEKTRDKVHQALDEHR